MLALLGIVIGGARIAVPYTIFQPGPTINVLGKLDGKQILEVHGHKTFPDTGDLRMVTIILSQPKEKISAWSALYAWLNPDDALYPFDAIYKPSETNAQNKQEDAQMMASSQDNAVAAAFTLAGIKYAEVPQVGTVKSGSPADGTLEVGDDITAVNAKPATTVQKVIDAVRPLRPGTPVSITVLRKGVSKTFTLRTAALGTTGKLRHQSLVGVGLGVTYTFPFSVKVRLSEQIGGPSAGMMFALSIYDLLTPGSLTGGKSVAGTGTITADGSVGEIGGIEQKIVGAQSDGAHLFLVPAGDCNEAVHAHYNPDKMRLVKVSTLKGAHDAIRQWVANPKASLPECS